MSFSKKLLTALSLFLALALPAFVVAESSSDSKTSITPKSYCWLEDECTSTKGTWVSKTNKECSSGYGFCYPYEENIDLQIKIGELSTVSSLKQYIPAVYNYAVSIVSIVAIVVIMIGGLQYLTAGGSPEKIGQAKEKILGAIIGLLLVMGSYTLLQTINPALLKWNIPKIKMVAPRSSQQWCSNTGSYEGKFTCGTPYTPSTKGTDGKTLPNISTNYCLGSYCKDSTEGCYQLLGLTGENDTRCILKTAAENCITAISILKNKFCGVMSYTTCKMVEHPIIFTATGISAEIKKVKDAYDKYFNIYPEGNLCFWSGAVGIGSCNAETETANDLCSQIINDSEEILF